MRDIFELLQKELKKINRVELLPAGVVLVGGSSLLGGLVELTKHEMHLPVEIGMPHAFTDSLEERIAPSFASVLGVLTWANQRSEAGFSGGRGGARGSAPWIRWLKTLLP